MARVNVHDAMANLLALQRKISIDGDPYLFRVNEAFLIPPNSEGLHGALPCWTNTFRFNNEERMGAAGRWRTYTVNMRLHVALQGENDEENGLVALAVLEEIHQAFGARDSDGDGGISLDGAVTQSKLRGTGSDTLVVFPGAGTIGLDLLLDLEIKDAGPTGGYS